jgi:hypothetical protein
MIQRIFSAARIGPMAVVCVLLGSIPTPTGAQTPIETQKQTAGQLEDERELLAELARSPVVQLKARFNTLSLNREFGKTDTDTEESRSLSALSLVKIVETRRAPDYGPLWSMVVAVRPNGTPLRTHDGKMIQGWAQTDHFDPPEMREPMLQPFPNVSDAPTTTQGANG